MSSVSRMLHNRQSLARVLAVLVLAGVSAGCTSYLIEREGKDWPGHYADCPVIYRMTRLELASLSWAISGDKKPSDSCLAHYYPKAGKDPTYQSDNRIMTPFYVLSFPVVIPLDTLVLPWTVSTALTRD
jgi:uncharacterized protein YceK